MFILTPLDTDGLLSPGAELTAVCINLQGELGGYLSPLLWLRAKWHLNSKVSKLWVDLQWIIPESSPKINSGSSHTTSISCILRFPKIEPVFQVSGSPQWPLLGIFPKLNKEAWTSRDAYLSLSYRFVPLHFTNNVQLCFNLLDPECMEPSLFL